MLSEQQTQTLEQLSAAATQGELLPCPFCGREAHIVERGTGPNGPGFFCAVSCYCGGYSAKAHQSATSNNDQMARVEAITRWNTRTGQLVAVQPDDATVERLARAMAPSVFEPFDPEKHGSPVNHEFAKAMWIRHAEKAIAAMKGPKP